MPLLFFCLFFIMRPEGRIIKRREKLNLNMKRLAIVYTFFKKLL